MRTRKGSPASLTGTITVPGDKSVSHRALIFAALADGDSVVTGVNLGDDVLATARCLAALGAGVEVDADEGRAVVTGGWGKLGEADGILDAGNSGTTLRLMLGVCAGVDGLSVLTGDATLRRRPMLRVVAPLREMGSRIDGRAFGNLAPLTVRGGPLAPLGKDLDVASAQVKSALMLAGMRAEGTTSVTEPSTSRDHTERMLGSLGVPVTVAGTTVAVTGPCAPPPFTAAVPGDVSSAAYLVAAALLVPGSRLEVTGVGLNPTRIAALEVLRGMGADLTWAASATSLGEPVGGITAATSELTGTEIMGAELIPRLIDELPVLAVVATQAHGRTVIADAAELRVKESDRIETMTEGLRRLGADVVATRDGMVIEGPTPLSGGEIDSCGDHRIALAFAVAGLVSSEKVVVRGWSAVETSFPGFLEVLDAARGRR